MLFILFTSINYFLIVSSFYIWGRKWLQGHINCLFGHRSLDQEGLCPDQERWWKWKTVSFMLWWNLTCDSHGKGRTQFIHKRDVSNCPPEGKAWQADCINNPTDFLLYAQTKNFVVSPTKEAELISLPFEFGPSGWLVLPNRMWQRPHCHWPKEPARLNHWFTDTSTEWMSTIVIYNTVVWSFYY